MAFVNDSLQLAALDIANIPASGPLGTAAATIDVASEFHIAQTAVGVTVTVPAPTPGAGAAGQLGRIVNTGTAAFTVGGVPISPNTYIDLVWSGTAWTQESDGGGTVRKFRIVQPLTAGASVITHGLGLTAPFAVDTMAINQATGQAVALRVSAETTNTVTLTAAVAVPSVRITVLG